MTQEMTALKERILQSSDDEQFELWNEIFQDGTSGTSHAESDIMNIVNSDEIALQISLCRFLALKEHLTAVELLCRLMLSDNRIVEERAIKSFLKNKHPEKNHTLAGLILPTTPKSCLLFAIETTCASGVTESLIPLLDLLSSTSTPMDVIEKILQGLRHIPDRRIWVSIQSFLHHEHEPYRFFALGVLGAMYERGFSRARPHLIHSCNDKSSRIRQASIWILRRSPKWRDERLLWTVIHSDRDAQVRQEAILGLVNFPSHRNIVRLVELFKVDPEPIVHLKVQALLLALPPKAVIRSLINILDSNAVDLKPIALKLFAYFEHDTTQALRYLQKLFKKSNSDKDRIHIIETIGSLKSSEAYVWLEQFLHSTPLVSYTAMSAMVRIWGNNSHFPILKYLRDESLAEPVRQIALKHFVKTSHRQDYHIDIIHFFVKLLDSNQLNVRYLASTGLAKSNDKRIFMPFVLSLLNETDLTAIRLLKHSIIQMIKEHPLETIPLLAQVSNIQYAQETLLQLLVDAHYSREQILEIWQPLLDVFSGESIIASMHKLCLLVLPLIKNHSLNLDSLLDAIQSESIRHLFISSILAHLRTDFKIRIHPPTRYYENKLRNLQTIHDFEIELLRYTIGTEALPILTRILCEPNLNAFHTLCASIINECLRRQEAA